MGAYREEDDRLRRRVSELESENEALQRELDDVDLALLRSENERLQRQVEGHTKRDRTLEVQAGKDRLARIFGAIAVGVGAMFFAAMIYIALEPPGGGRSRGRLMLCLVSFAIMPTAWGILRLVRGAERGA